MDNTVDYRDPDVERFWAGGERAVSAILGELGLEIGASDTVVEIGLASGGSRVSSPSEPGVVALDVSSETLARARELNLALGNVTWLHGDGKSLAGWMTRA